MSAPGAYRNRTVVLEFASKCPSQACECGKGHQHWGQPSCPRPSPAGWCAIATPPRGIRRAASRAGPAPCRYMSPLRPIRQQSLGPSGITGPTDPPRERTGRHYGSARRGLTPLSLMRPGDGVEDAQDDVLADTGLGTETDQLIAEGAVAGPKCCCQRRPEGLIRLRALERASTACASAAAQTLCPCDLNLRRRIAFPGYGLTCR